MTGKKRYEMVKAHIGDYAEAIIAKTEEHFSGDRHALMEEEPSIVWMGLALAIAGMIRGFNKVHGDDEDKLERQHVLAAMMNAAVMAYLDGNE